MASPIHILAPENALPAYAPHLMPFHIAYSGPAPIATYFRVRPAPSSPDEEPKEGAANDASSAEKARFAAAFRGRAMQGVEVQLPEGYGGVLLRDPRAADEGPRGKRRDEAKTKKGKAKEKATATGRPSRRASAMNLDEEEEEMEEPQAKRVLLPSAQFSSFVLWNPDIPVDEGRDEYLRSLSEWVGLAKEIHHYDD